MKSRLLALLLVLTCTINIFYQGTSVNAQTVKEEMELIYSSESKDGNKVEVSKYGDVNYYYEIDGDLTITYDMTDNIINYYVNDKKLIYSGQLNVSESKKMTYDSIREDIIATYKLESKITPLSDYITEPDQSKVGSNTHNKVVECVQDKYHYSDPYYFFYDYRLLSDNRKLDLYSSAGYYVEDYSEKKAFIGDSIALVTALFGLSTLTVKSMWKFTRAASGILVGTELMVGTIYQCTFAMSKDVMLGQQLKYQSVRQIKQRVVMKDLEFFPSDDYVGSWSTDSDFYHIQEIFDNAELNL